METGLEGKPIHFGILTCVAMIGVMVGVVYYLMIKQMNLDIKRQVAKYESLQADVAKGRSAKKSLPQFREEVRRLQLELDKLLNILPSQRKTEEILRRVRALTEQGDFDLISFSPGSPRQMDEFFSEWAIKIQLQGGYHNLALFFDRISRFRRIINIGDLRISPVNARGGSSYTISATFSFITFPSKEPVDDEEEGI